MLQKTRKLRILLLLIVLFIVAMNTWLAKIRTTDWHSPLWVALYPINGDGSSNTTDYIHQLQESDFGEVETFFADEGGRYGIAIDTPVTLKLAPEVKELPPPPPRQAGMLEVMLWSLKLRYWAWQNDSFKGPANAQLYLVYHDPQQHQRLAHSTGLEKGLVGIVNLFADKGMRRQNHVILAHEFLHLVGASDKYDLATNLPRFPDGYAEPQRSPRYPQGFAELMGGRIPLAANRAEIPESLDEVLIGEATAVEINWVKRN
jgi:hypothetical protein